MFSIHCSIVTATKLIVLTSDILSVELIFHVHVAAHYDFCSCCCDNDPFWVLTSPSRSRLHRVFRQHVCIESYDEAVAQSPSRSRLHKVFRQHVYIEFVDEAVAQSLPTTCLH